MISRYQSDEMKFIWSDENKFNKWKDIEIYSLEAFCELGMIPPGDIKEIKNNLKFDYKRVYEIEKETRHDVVAFTRALSESLGCEKKWIHYGLTSTDVVDTTNGALIRDANEIIEEKILKLISNLKDMAIKYKNTIQMGRTHGIHADLTTFGYKIALYYDEMLRNYDRFKLAREQIEIGKISGAVGTYANVDPFVQEYVCNKLGINSSKISTQTLQRDRHAFYISTLAIIGNSIEKFCIEFRSLQRTEINEVEEGFFKKQKGSSAMPHKKNPISSENLCGLSRVLRGYVITAFENEPLWHERDISHSSAERIIIPDATSLLEYMLNRFNDLIENLHINEEQMKNNIYITNNVFFAQRVMHLLIDNGFSREEAYDIVQPIAIDCYENKKDFKVYIYSNIEKYVEKNRFEECFDISYVFENIDKIFERLEIYE